MVRVPAGIYLMGLRFGSSFEERPMHEVVVASFDLDETEVTMNAYAACVAAGACAPPKATNPFCNAHFEDRGEHPVNCVDFRDAEAFCAWAGKRLPTEREWEYAARGGAERRTFSWGEEPADEARACYKHPGGSCVVGSYPAGAFGLKDMNGNVWEWTSSWYGPYPDELATGQFKVYRGGSWSRRFPKWLRNELRNRYKVDEHSASLGIRCAKTVSPLTCPAEASPKDGVCVRTRGTPTCEEGTAWSGTACSAFAPGAVAAGPRPSTVPAASSAGDTQPAASASPATDAGGAPAFVRSRTPQHDGDCQRNWPATPAAYRWEGGTFHSRNGPIAAAGCQKRDMGRTWTSACCRS
jgi:hypothetical protein